MFADTTIQQALRKHEHQEQLCHQHIRERKHAEALECLKQEHHEEPKPQDSWWTTAHRTRLSSSRSSSCSNHVGDHEHRRHQPQGQPQHGAPPTVNQERHHANQQHHLDSLCERKKPIPRKDESHIHIESKSDTPHELSEDILLSNNLTSTPLVLSSSLLGCSDNDDVPSMEMRDSTICEMSESTICEMSESTICESKCFHFEGMSDTPSETRVVVVDRSSEAISISITYPLSRVCSLMLQ
jgi:hypothetical protein